MKISSDDWLKLYDFAEKIARSIQPKLPLDWYLDLNEIKSEVFQSFVYLISVYKDGAMSVTSWCWRYGENKTMQKLMAEYRRLKNQDAMYDESDDDEVKHQYGEYEFEPQQSLTEHVEQKEIVNELLDKANDEDKEMMKLVIDGYSYDEIGKRFGITAQAVNQRLKKYSKA